MHFARHLRQQALGEFTVGTDLYRSESLALTQLIVLYHVVTARAAGSLGGRDPRETALEPDHQALSPAQAQAAVQRVEL